ncbi:MFS transporter [Microbacterium gorillae]|uniref:MFS transporter n=1 Tax=Microbacterium gorillae TaxID=1231063 RepID=UPI00058D4862|nr:MFS transporter [Microbacterium gorillae]
MHLDISRSQFVRWRAAIFAIFAACGIGFATWASRVPAIKEALDISKTEIGLLLVTSGVASIIGLSVSSVVMLRFGAKRSMLGLLLLAAVGIVLIGVGADVFHSFPIVIGGLVLFGFGNGCCDVVMNVEGAAVETHGGKTVLPMMHGFFSLGTFVGAGLGAVAEAVHLPVSIHTAAIGVVIVVVAFVAVANIPTGTDAEAADDVGERQPFRQRLKVALSAWTEPRTYGLGLVMLGMSFAEGGANDWLALGVVEGHDGSTSLGAIGLAVFAASMTFARMVGGPIVDRFGRVASLRVLAAMAVAGLLLFVFAPNLPLVFLGIVLWGLGASLGFPLGMSAAADDPAHAASRVSAASTIGYVAFLAGPPMLGFVADHIGLLPTLLIVAALALMSGFATPAARPLPGSEQARIEARSRERANAR